MKEMKGQSEAGSYDAGWNNSRFLAEVKGFIQNLDEAKLDGNLCPGAVLDGGSQVLVSGMSAHAKEKKLLTSIVSSTLPEAVTVRFWPGFGGSGDTCRDSSWMMSVGVPGVPDQLGFFVDRGQ